MNGKWIKPIVGVVIIGGALSFFIFQAMQSSWAYYYSVDEFMDHQAQAKNVSLRLAGTVKAGTVVNDMEQMTLAFDLAGTSATLPVIFNGVVPENFEENKEVVVEGRFDSAGKFQADKLMTRCESKYESKLETEPKAGE